MKYYATVDEQEFVIEVGHENQIIVAIGRLVDRVDARLPGDVVVVERVRPLECDEQRRLEDVPAVPARRGYADADAATEIIVRNPPMMADLKTHVLDKGLSSAEDPNSVFYQRGLVMSMFLAEGIAAAVQHIGQQRLWLAFSQQIRNSPVVRAALELLDYAALGTNNKRSVGWQNRSGVRQ